MADVVVVGAGPIGCLAALLAARRGAAVTLIERRASISERPRAMGIHPPAARVLRDAGVDLDDAARIDRGTARERGRVVAELRFREPVLSLPQHRIEASLRCLLADEPRVRLITGAAGRLAEAGAAARLAGPVSAAGSLSGDVRRRSVIAEGTGERIDAGFVIAADGVASALRAQAGVRWRRRAGRARYLMADIEDASILGSEAALWFVAGGVVESFPLPEGRRRWVARTGPAVAAAPGNGVTVGPEAAAHDLAGFVRERTGMVITVPATAVSGFTATQHLAGRWVDQGLVLVGDAAHEVSPIGGQGMNLGLLNASRLAEPLERALNGDQTALGEWERAGRASARRAMAQAAFNMAVGAPLPAALQPGRRAGILALSLWRDRLADAFTMARL